MIWAKTLREFGLLVRDEILGAGLLVAVWALIVAAPFVGRARSRRAASVLVQSYARMVQAGG